MDLYSLEGYPWMKPLPLTNFMTSDIFNVMKRARGSVIAKLHSTHAAYVYCICHLVHLFVKSAIKTLSFKVDNLFVDICYHFWHNVKRVTLLQDYAEFALQITDLSLKHWGYLLGERQSNHLIEMWDPLASYFTSHRDVDRHDKVKTRSLCYWKIKIPPTTVYFLSNKTFLTSLMSFPNIININSSVYWRLFL